MSSTAEPSPRSDDAPSTDKHEWGSTTESEIGTSHFELISRILTEQDTQRQRLDVTTNKIRAAIEASLEHGQFSLDEDAIRRAIEASLRADERPAPSDAAAEPAIDPAAPASCEAGDVVVLEIVGSAVRADEEADEEHDWEITETEEDDDDDGFVLVSSSP